MAADIRSMRKILDDLESALQAQTPPMTAAFAEPATEAEIREAERRLEITFPDDLTSFLLCANGQQTDEDDIYPAGDFIIPRMKVAPDIPELSAWGQLLQLDKIVTFTQYQFEIEEFGLDEGRILYGPVVNHTRQIILTQADDPVSIALDLQPAEGGRYGQVVSCNDQPDYLLYLAPDLASFLQRLVDGYRSKRFQQAEDGTVSEAQSGG